MEQHYSHTTEQLAAENARLQAQLAEKDQELQAVKTRLEHAQLNLTGLSCLKKQDDLQPLLFLAEEVFAAVFLTDVQGVITWANRGFSKLCCCEPHEVIGRPARDVLTRNLNDEAVLAYINTCLRQQQPVCFDVPPPCKSCGVSWIRVKAQPIFGPEGKLLFYAGLIEDVSDWKTAEQQLSRNEKRLRTLIENVPGVLYEWRYNFDGTFEFVYVSPKTQELFGVEASMADCLIGYIHPEDQLRFYESVQHSARTRAPWHFEGRMQVPGQPLCWWQGNSTIAEEDELGFLYRGILHDITAVKLAHEAVRESEQRWRMAMAQVGNETWEYHYPSRKLQMPAYYRELLGYDENRKIEPHEGTEPWFTNVEAEDQATALKAAAAYLHGETPLYSVTYRVNGKSDRERWILSRGMITKRDEQGNPEILTGSYTDVTEVTQARLAQEASTLRLASTIANLQRAVLLEDENLKVILVNDAFCRLFKLPYSPAQLIGADCALLLEHMKASFPDPESFVCGVAAIRRQQPQIRGEVLQLKDGILLERDSAPIRANGKYIGYLWNYDDVTQHKNEEDALKRREEKYRSILENLNLGLVEVDLDGQVMFVNDSYCEITGYSKDELLHNNLDKLLVNEAGRTTLRQKRKSRTEGVSDTYEMPMRTKRGDLKWLLISGAPLYNDEKQFIGSIGVHLDISHQKQLEVKLRTAKQHAEESSRAKELFLANMSHEMRTPMNAIVGMSQLLGKTPLGAQQRNYLHAISNSAENLLVIINDILDLSKIEAGKMTLETIGFNLHRVCEQVEKTLRYKAEDKGLRLLVQVCPDMPEVLLGDPHRIIQVLLNLAGNSVKFTEKGEVEVICELAGTLGHEVVVGFTVRDTGIGIDPKYLKNLFNDFSQEDSSVSRKFGGTGLGLSISRSLVNLMGGEIQIQSTKMQGTLSTFSLLLPIGSTADLPRKELTINAKQTRKKLRGKRVLLVEDNEYNRMLAQTFLRQAGMEVTEAENGAVAVELARQQEFDLVLMDVQMPVLDGYDATVKLRQELGLKIPIIALTANAIRGDNEKCLAVGMNDYLSKPYHEDELLHIVHEWLQPPADSTEEPRLYRLDLLQEVANNDQNFVGVMLRTFLRSGEAVLTSLRQGLEANDMTVLKDAAHKIKPSLAHLQIHQVLEPMEQIDNWAGPFDEQSVAPLVEITEKLLQQVMAQITLDLKTNGA